MREGESFAAALEARKVFPEVAVKMAEVGESTGALQDMLNTVADFYDEEISTTMERFVTLVEPVLLVFMGIVIAGLLLALYMPLFQLSSVSVAVTEWLSIPTSTSATAGFQPTRPESAPIGIEISAPRSSRRGASPSATGSSSSTWTTFRIDQDLFRSIPADLMLRYGFVPHRRVGKALEIVVSDPTDLPMIDELGGAAGDADQGRGRVADRRSSRS